MIGLTHRGCKIQVETEKCMGGWEEVYHFVVSPEGFYIDDGFGLSCDEQEVVDAMKQRIDEFYDVFNGDEDKYSEHVWGES